MTKEYNYKQRLIAAKKHVRRIQLFYVHLAGYLIIVALLLYNLSILEEGEYKKVITWLNLTTLVCWSIFIAIHAWRVFKGRLLFKKSWEDRKIKEFLKDEEALETTFWE